MDILTLGNCQYEHTTDSMPRGEQEESETGGSVHNEFGEAARGENGDCNARNALSMEGSSDIDTTVSRYPSRRLVR